MLKKSGFLWLDPLRFLRGWDKRKAGLFVSTVNTAITLKPLSLSMGIPWASMAKWLVLSVLFLAFVLYGNPRLWSAEQIPFQPSQEKDAEHARAMMVKEQIAARGIRDERVLAAMARVPRHEFVPQASVSTAYGDFPLPIGHGQTISQPYIVAIMTEAAQLKPMDRVLEIGTGSGYQAAILAELVQEVFTIEIVEPLARESEERLKALGYTNITVRHGDGYLGWPEEAPFDAIIVTAAPEEIPQALVEQLAVGGRMVVPVGTFYQELIRIVKTEAGIQEERLLPVRFVPMIKGEK